MRTVGFTGDALDAIEAELGTRGLASGWGLGIRVARLWRRRCLGGMVTGGLAVTVYSPPMTGNRLELPGSYRGFEIVNQVVAQ
jgi:hypothetical protein